VHGLPFLRLFQVLIDVELVSILEADARDSEAACAGQAGGYSVAFDAIYPGETWCRSVVEVDPGRVAELDAEPDLILRAARDALVVALLAEALPVSFHLRLTVLGTEVLARATPR